MAAPILGPTGRTWSAGLDPATTLNPVPEDCDPYNTWLEREAVGTSVQEHDGGNEDDDKTGDDEVVDTETMNVLAQLRAHRLWALPAAEAKQKLLEFLEQNPETDKDGKRKAKQSESRRQKAVRLQMQCVYARMSEYGGGKRLVPGLLWKKIEEFDTAATAAPAPGSLDAQLEELETSVNEVIRDFNAKAVNVARLQPSDVALVVQHMQTLLKQRTELVERVAQAQRDEQAALKNDAALDYMVEHLRTTNSAATALTTHDPDASITQYSHTTMGAYLHDPDDNRPELADLATVADYEVTSAQSAVTKIDMMLEAADRDRELGLTPQLRVPRTRVAGPRISAQVWCRQCDVPSDEEFRQEWDNEQPLNEPKQPAPAQRTRARATYVQTISEVYLGELHRLIAAAPAGAGHAPLVRQALENVVAHFVRLKPDERVKTAAFCGAPSCRKRAQRACSWTCGCYIMKQLGCHNAEGKQNKREAKKASALVAQRFGTHRYPGYYLLKNDLRVLHVLFALRLIDQRDVLDMVQFVVHYSAWFAERERKALATGHFMASNAESFGFSLQNQDPNKFVERCGDLFLDFATDAIRRLIIGAPLPTVAGRDGGAALEQCTIEQSMAWLEAQLPLALNANLPLATDVALRVRNWYITSSTICLNSSIKSAALKTLVSVGAFSTTWLRLWHRMRCAAKNHGRHGGHVPISAYHLPGQTVEDYESVSIVPKGVADLHNFEAANHFKAMMKLNGAIDWTRVFASVAKDAPSIRELQPKTQDRDRLNYNTARSPQQCEARHWGLSLALARCERGWQPGRLHGDSLMDAAKKLQSLIMHDSTTTNDDSLIGQYRPLSLEDNLQVLMAQAAAHDLDFARMPPVGKAVGVFQLAGADAKADAPAAETPSAQDGDQEQRVAQDVAMLNDAFAQLLNCDINPDHGWNGDEKWIGAAPHREQEAADLAAETRMLLVGEADAAERQDLITKLLDALGELDVFARAYAARLVQTVSREGATRGWQMVQPMEHTDFRQHTDAVLSGAKLMHALVSALADLDFHTAPMHRADDPDAPPRPDSLNMTHHDILEHVVHGPHRKAAFATALRQTTAKNQYALETAAGNVVQACEAHQRTEALRVQIDAMVQPQGDAGVRLLPSVALAELRCVHTNALAPTHQALKDFFARLLPYLARRFVAFVWLPTWCIAEVEAKRATSEAELEAVQQQLDALDAQEDAGADAYAPLNAQLGTLTRSVERLTKQIAQRQKVRAAEEARLKRLLRETHLIRADELRPADVDEYDARLAADAEHSIPSQFRAYLKRAECKGNELKLKAVRRRCDWPVDACTKPPDEGSMGLLLDSALDMLRTAIAQHGGLTIGRDFPDLSKRNAKDVKERMEQIEREALADLSVQASALTTAAAPRARATEDECADESDEPSEPLHELSVAASALSGTCAEIQKLRELIALTQQARAEHGGAARFPALDMSEGVTADSAPRAADGTDGTDDDADESERLSTALQMGAPAPGALTDDIAADYAAARPRKPRKRKRGKDADTLVADENAEIDHKELAEFDLTQVTGAMWHGAAAKAPR